MRKTGWTALAVLMLSACAQQNEAESEAAADAAAPAETETAAKTDETTDEKNKADGPVHPPLDPYPSTYEPYPGETVLLTGATLLTGGGIGIQYCERACIGPRIFASRSVVIRRFGRVEAGVVAVAAPSL